MQMLYNSEAFAVVRFDVQPAAEPVPGASPAQQPLSRGGFEIIDKAARREIYLEGLLAEHFQQGAQALQAAGEADTDRYDEYIARFAGLAQQPLMLH